LGRKSVKGGSEFTLMDATTKGNARRSITQACRGVNRRRKAGKPYTAVTLPFNTFNFVDGETAIEITVTNTAYAATLLNTPVEPTPPVAEAVGRTRGRGGGGGLADRFERRSTSTPSKPESPDGKLEARPTTTTSRFGKWASRRSRC
jgi:hypothetical protein